jgi:ubiquinol-cytochrome c reductase core subunit 2
MATFIIAFRTFFVDVLSSFLTSAKFTRHEFEEYVTPVVEGDVASATANPAIRAIELAHALAFRTGLGSSLLAPTHSSFSAEDIKSFAASTFTKNNIAILGTGIEQSVLTQLVDKSLASAPATSTAGSSPTSKYHGGESRIASSEGPQTAFIGFGAVGAPSADLAALAAHLSPQPSIKWSKGISPLASAIPVGTTVQPVYLPYSDATLVGLLVQGQTVADVKEAGKAAVHALKSAAATGGVSTEELKKAAAKAKFAAANALDSREGLVSVLGAKVCCLGRFYSPPG